jgi:hypothetical protein
MHIPTTPPTIAPTIVKVCTLVDEEDDAEEDDVEEDDVEEDDGLG